MQNEDICGSEEGNQGRAWKFKVAFGRKNVAGASEEESWKAQDYHYTYLCSLPQ